MKQYDVVFIGSGHAAWHAALTLKHAGKDVAIIEKDTIAGTCTNYGCNAKILLEGPYEVLEESAQYNGIIQSQDLHVNWENLMDYKKQVINPMNGMLKGMFEQQGIDVYMGAGVIKDAHTVTVNDEALQTENIVIATGQHSNKLDIEGKELTHDSRDFLSMDELPKRMTFIGVGIISVEFASIMIKSGVEVTMIHHSDKPLKGFNQTHVTQLIKKLEDEGVHFYFDEETQKVEKIGEAYKVSTASGLTIDTDYVLDATGRNPNVEGIGLDQVGIEYSKKGISVDGHLRTNVSNIYASGDVLDKAIPKLTPTATFESNYIAAHILGMTQDEIQYPAIPSVLYSLPRLSQIGVSVQGAEQNERYTVKHIPFGKQMAFEYKNETDAEMYVVLDEEKRLVGADIYGVDAADLVNLLVFIINQRMTAQDLNQLIFAFPGASSGVIDMLKVNML
ncbi:MULTISPECIES: dihydrolipoyl dehydrogenase family protein [Staphylococcus]|mgnify:FL=1|jgi:glutathione reductase (NADPH)|uniref:NAD(P)/FAD-dependent oxidoreductase n=3 Tax=Staphylococcus haemolyticus TaxID=1283 RepID=A0ABU3IEG8_STAHA|nr:MULTISPECIES: NAD(P)/FAD-dependent oxidoreductase [Staphylococcus]KDP47824.1 pyridine nucleotide-disulfide oxidoreductase [Staphylococcus aureus subsp. aureus CO-98]MDU2096689.1 NAD(P)/FAD-dependent oxidoreductase [Staphylococcus sp.]AKC75029.1 dihydrolipoamide dehydrogenase component of pyruvate dehydrogenase E3 [Staphylococcus haemolyticus]AUV66336.1 NAD(P)/FAD-dependent oxidoreductase [Staphylococcus haemolyticus]AUV68719.1 NAD(P)/FAD-dependent oxidoreductase [Staphylococcus haemolyticus